MFFVCFSTHIFETWLACIFAAPGNLAGKSYLILSGEFVYYHEKGKARNDDTLWKT